MHRIWCALQVDVLHLNFQEWPLGAFLHTARDLMTTHRDLVLNVQLCSANLTELHLEALLVYNLRDWYSNYRDITWHDLKVRACLRRTLSWLVLGAHRDDLACCGSQDAICQCQQLRSLHICVQEKGEHGRSELGGLPPDGSHLLMHFSAALPKLTTLLWRRPPLSCAHTQRHFLAEFAGSRAAERLPGTGLRILHAEHCAFEWDPYLRAPEPEGFQQLLPASLQILSLYNLGRGHTAQQNAHGGWEDVFQSYARKGPNWPLQSCAALRELYILQTKVEPQSAQNFLDLPRIATSCPALRVLVLHPVMERAQEVNHSWTSFPCAPVACVRCLACLGAFDDVPCGCAGRSVWQGRVCPARTGDPRDYHLPQGD